MDIKIVCGCGQKYIFEVDPDNGLMGASVTCPACGADGSQEASEILAQILAFSHLTHSTKIVNNFLPLTPHLVVEL
jgi:hypothetical protein